MISVCADHFYNSSCTAKCGNCLNKEHCDKRNGTCIKGCQPHFQYPLCTGNIQILSFIFERLTSRAIEI